jgi:hypothetical protein
MIEKDYEDLMDPKSNNYAGLPVKYVVAGNYNEYQAYVKRKPRIEYYYKYVSSVDTIRGLSSIEGCFIGSYASRKDIEDIKTLIIIIKSKQQINSIEPLKYEWKDPGPSVGFVAQEIDHVLPDAFFKAVNGGDIEEYMKK